MSIENTNTPNEMARKIQNQLHNLIKSGNLISLVWIPSHNQISGNERANEKAQVVIPSYGSLLINNFKLHVGKMISKIISNNLWQRLWMRGSTKTE